MRREKFESMCSGAKVLPAKRIDVKDGIILIADSGTLSLRDLRKDSEDRNLHCTLWAFGKDEDNLEIGQSLYFKPFFKDKEVWRAATKEVRIAAAEQTAREWLDARSRAH